jgi:hypothetical protein
VFERRVLSNPPSLLLRKVGWETSKGFIESG